VWHDGRTYYNQNVQEVQKVYPYCNVTVILQTPPWPCALLHARLNTTCDLRLWHSKFGSAPALTGSFQGAAARQSRPTINHNGVPTHKTAHGCLSNSTEMRSSYSSIQLLVPRASLIIDAEFSSSFGSNRYWMSYFARRDSQCSSQKASL